MKVVHIDAFTTVPNKGNPAGVVLDADAWPEERRVAIASKVGFNETVFVQSSDIADFKLKYYTPGHEINLCGHATMAAIYCLRSNGLIDSTKPLTIETNVGVLPISFEGERIRMQQSKPRFLPFAGNVEKLMNTIGLTANDLDSKYPIVYGSTGTWTLLIPLKRLSAFEKMTPNNKLFPDALPENSRASLHPFCMETIDPEAFMHARHFSSPYSGTVEDPVTGTASGVIGAYYLSYMQPELDHARFIVEQGQEVGREGRVRVEAYRTNGEVTDIFISGDAVFVKEMEIEA